MPPLSLKNQSMSPAYADLGMAQADSVGDQLVMDDMEKKKKMIAASGNLGQAGQSAAAFSIFGGSSGGGFASG